MDETLKRIADRLSQRRTELQEHLDGSSVWESTTAELLERVQRLQERLDGGAAQKPAHEKA